MLKGLLETTAQIVFVMFVAGVASGFWAYFTGEPYDKEMLTYAILGILIANMKPFWRD